MCMSKLIKTIKLGLSIYSRCNSVIKTQPVTNNECSAFKPLMNREALEGITYRNWGKTLPYFTFIRENGLSLFHQLAHPFSGPVSIKPRSPVLIKTFLPLLKSPCTLQRFKTSVTFCFKRRF